MKMAHKLVGIGVFLAVICGLIGDFSIVHSALADPPGANVAGFVEIIPLDDFEASGEPGGPFTPPSKEYQLTYNGEEDYVYCVIEKTADWLDLNPDWVRLDPCVPEIITVSLNETAETLPEGIHNDTLIFTVVNTGEEYIRDVVLTIEAPSGVLEITPLEGFEAAGDIGGPFEPASKEYLLKNIGSAPLFWGIDDPCEWLEWNETSGNLDPCESTTVTVSITAAAELLEEGTYYDTLRFNDLSNDVTYTRNATLSIVHVGGIWVEPESFDEIVIEGTHLTKTLTIGNDGAENVDYTIQTRIVGGSGDMAGTMAGGADDGDFFQASIKHDFTELGTDPYKPGELIVRFASRAGGQLRSLTEKKDILKSLGGGSIERNFTIVPGLSLVKLPAGLTVEEALVQYNNDDGILYAQPNYEVRAISTFPDDTRFNDLWGMHNTGQTGGTPDADIDAPEAWDIATGSSEIIVAVIDTGVDYTHPDLTGNMWVNQPEFEGTPGVDDDGNGYVDDIYGYDFCNNDGNPMDDHYHGTHCAGTVGATGNNGEGVAGVCWNVRIMAVKFLDSGGGGWTSDAIDCVEYCTLMGANVTSNSWGGGSYSQGLKDVIDAAGAAGILFVAAAGNDYGGNNDTYPHYPSSYNSTNLIAVMSTDKYDNMSSFSNYGPASVDLGAPGTGILSCQLGGGYKTISGTSMATPHVAGACALLWSVNPALSDQEVRDILLRTVDPTLGGLCVSEGRLNIYNAMLETSVPWLDVSPEEGTVPPLDANDVSVTFNPAGMEPGVYEAEILIISSDPLRPTIIVPVTMTLIADDLALSPDAGFESSGVEGGPFMPQCMNYTLTNNGNEPVSWTTAPTADWLEVAPSDGVLDPCDTTGISLCISPQAELLQPGVYTETLTLENLESGSIKTRPITLTVIPPDSFTESFGSGGSDLHNLMLTLRPDGSSAYYAACYEEATQFPTDPFGGTDIALGDDDFAEIILNQSAQVSFYGQSYDRIYIGSNGYITFGQGDVEHEALLENHFALPRISAMFADLTPPDGQSISWKQLEDRLAVTYENVPLFGDKQKISSFQIEIFFTDETIRITRLNLAATSSIMGISRGTGIPAGFFESDLSEYLICCPCGDFDGDYTVNLLDFAILAASWLDDTCESPYWCDWTDIDRSNVVDPPDLACLTQNWLYGAGPEPEPNLPEPIAYWKFDEGEGDTAYDSVGDNHGTLYGDPCWIGGKIGPFAIDFDGYGDYVSIGSFLHDFDEDTTYIMWVEMRAGGSTKTLFDTRNSEMTSDSLVAWIDTLNHQVEVFGGGSVKSFTFHPVLNTWYHIAIVHNDSVNDVIVYVNGLPLDVDTGNIGNPTYGNHDFAIGARADIQKEFDGKIDDVRVYDRVLSDDEIQALYQTTTQSVGQDSQYYWSEPVLLEELNDIPNGKNAYSPSLSQDGLTIFFGRRSASGTRQLVEAYRDTPDGPFTTERVISELVTGDNLYSPWISNDELRLYYGRYENGTTLRMAQRNSPTDTWTDVKGFYEIHVGGTSDSHTTLMPDELTMFYCSNRYSDNYFIWTTNRPSRDDPFSAPAPVSELNDGEKSAGPCILPDGLTIYFHAIRDGHATADIYKATRSSIDVPFGNVERISISTDTEEEYCPDVTPDEKTLYFHSDQGIFVSYWEKDEITICLPG